MAKNTTAVPTATAPATIHIAHFDATKLRPPADPVGAAVADRVDDPAVDPPGVSPCARKRAITSAADWGRDAVSFARQSATSDSHSCGTEAIES